MTTIYDAFLQGTRYDLEGAQRLKNGPYSLALYLVEQSLEKSCKALYSYLMVTRVKANENSINAKLVGFSHNNTEMISELYLEICQVEDKEIDNIPEPSLRYKEVKRLMKEKLSGLRAIAHSLGKTTRDQKELLTTYTSQVQRAYNQYKKFEPFIIKKAKEVVDENRLTGTEKVAQPHPFELFFAISRALVPCVFMKNNLYRYPSKEYNYENLEILNKNEMQRPCNLIIEMTEAFVNLMPKLMKPGLLALA